MGEVPHWSCNIPVLTSGNHIFTANGLQFLKVRHD